MLRVIASSALSSRNLLSPCSHAACSLSGPATASRLPTSLSLWPRLSKHAPRDPTGAASPSGSLSQWKSTLGSSGDRHLTMVVQYDPNTPFYSTFFVGDALTTVLCSPSFWISQTSFLLLQISSYTLVSDVELARYNEAVTYPATMIAILFSFLIGMHGHLAPERRSCLRAAHHCSQVCSPTTATRASKSIGQRQWLAGAA